MGIPDELAARNREIQRRLFALARSRRRKPADRRRSRARKRGPFRRRSRRRQGSAGRAARRRRLALVPLLYLDFDPRPVLARSRCPVLALYGSLDLQAPPDLNAPAMRAAPPPRAWRCSPGLNHMLQHAQTGSPVEYTRIEETVAPEVLEMVGDWLRSR